MSGKFDTIGNTCEMETVFKFDTIDNTCETKTPGPEVTNISVHAKRNPSKV